MNAAGNPPTRDNFWTRKDLPLNLQKRTGITMGRGEEGV